jgi:hypothetical protein
VSFGFFNKLPLRPIDLERMKKKQGMAGVFDKLTGDLQHKTTHNAKS